MTVVTPKEKNFTYRLILIPESNYLKRIFRIPHVSGTRFYCFSVLSLPILEPLQFITTVTESMNKIKG